MKRLRREIRPPKPKSIDHQRTKVRIQLSQFQKLQHTQQKRRFLNIWDCATLKFSHKAFDKNGIKFAKSINNNKNVQTTLKTTPIGVPQSVLEEVE